MGGRKIKFALELANGVKVRSNLEELREKFDLEKVVGYFLSGKLAEWLEDRYYDAEAAKIKAIDKDSPEFHRQLCEALGVDYVAEEELDVEQLERLNEKKAILRQKTDNGEIIAHAAQTALTQEDLADLLDFDEPTIYLCGEKFNIPIRVENKKYIGVLGSPTIEIQASTQAEIDAKGIIFENVKLPWKTQAKIKEEAATAQTIESVSVNKTWRIPKEQLKTMFASTFQKDFENCRVDATATFMIVRGKLPSTQNLTDEQKAMALSLICGNKYTEDDLIHLRISKDMARGWAFTRDSFCIANGDVSAVIPYESLSDIPVPTKSMKKQRANVIGDTVAKGTSPVLGQYGLILPDGSAFVNFNDLLRNREYEGSKSEATVECLKAYLTNLNNLFCRK